MDFKSLILVKYFKCIFVLPRLKDFLNIKLSNAIRMIDLHKMMDFNKDVGKSRNEWKDITLYHTLTLK